MDSSSFYSSFSLFSYSFSSTFSSPSFFSSPSPSPSSFFSSFFLSSFFLSTVSSFTFSYSLAHLDSSISFNSNRSFLSLFNALLAYFLVTFSYSKLSIITLKSYSCFSYLSIIGFPYKLREPAPPIDMCPPIAIDALSF